MEKAKGVNACQHEANGKGPFEHIYLLFQFPVPTTPAGRRPAAAYTQLQYAGAYAAIREGVGAAVVVVMAVACRTGFSRESRCGVRGIPDESRRDLKDHSAGSLIAMSTLSNALQLWD
jgi:hypothetical protein